MKIPLMLTGEEHPSAFLCIVPSGGKKGRGVAGYIKDTKNNIISPVLFNLDDTDILEMLNEGELK